MATRITIKPPIVIGEDTKIEALVLRNLRCGDLFEAGRALGSGGTEEIKNRVAAIAANLPFAATRMVPLAVQTAIETWWSKQWTLKAAALPPTVREPIAGDWFDAYAASGERIGELEMQARVYCACADLTLDAIAGLPLATLDAIKLWYDKRAEEPVTVEEIEEAGSAVADPSPGA